MGEQLVKIVRVRGREALARGEIEDQIWYAAIESEDRAIDAVRIASKAEHGDVDVEVVGHLESVSREHLELPVGEVRRAS